MATKDRVQHMEAFALMREELKRTRELKSDLLAALVFAVPLLLLAKYRVPLPDAEEHGRYDATIKLASAAIARATGGDA